MDLGGSKMDPMNRIIRYSFVQNARTLIFTSQGVLADRRTIIRSLTKPGISTY